MKMASRRRTWNIPFATERKVRNRGFTPIVYFTDAGSVTGWIVSEAGNKTRIAVLTSDPRKQRIVVLRGKARRDFLTLDEFRRRYNLSKR